MKIMKKASWFLVATVGLVSCGKGAHNMKPSQVEDADFKATKILAPSEISEADLNLAANSKIETVDNPIDWDAYVNRYGDLKLFWLEASQPGLLTGTGKYATTYGVSTEGWESYFVFYMNSFFMIGTHRDLSEFTISQFGKYHYAMHGKSEGRVVTLSNLDYEKYVSDHRDVYDWFAEMGRINRTGSYAEKYKVDTTGWEARWLAQMNRYFGTSLTDPGQFDMASYGKFHFEYYGIRDRREIFALVPMEIAYRSDVELSFTNQVSLDVHYGETGKVKPVFMFIHGGGWISGDKAEVVKNGVSQVGDFARDNGYILVAANYRLVDPSDPQKVTYKDQASDVAHAVAWVKKNISRYGGNPENIVPVGHSAGAHLVPLMILDSRYLNEVGLDSSAVRKAISLDVHAYDIPYAISLMTSNSSFSAQITSLERMFGYDGEQQREASPSNYVVAGRPMPSFLVISAGWKDGVKQNITNLTSEAFVKDLKRAGIESSHSYFQNETHSTLVSDLNKHDDLPAASIKTFLSQ